VSIVSNSSFSVHKSTVVSNRKALALYLIKQNRAAEVPVIMSQLIDLDTLALERGWGDRVPLDIVTKDIDLAAQLLKDDYLGLKIIELVDLPYLPLYRGINQCLVPFLRDNTQIPFAVLLRILVRYFKVITEVVQVRIEPYENCSRIIFEPSIPEAISVHQMDGAMLGVYRILQTYSPLLPQKLGLSLRDCSLQDEGISYDDYKQYFSIAGEPSEQNYLEYSFIQESVLKQSQFCIGPLQNMLDKEFPNFNYSERCQHILTTTMSILEPTREQVSMVLNMSVSTLQRRLRQEGSSFHSILLSTRKALAHEYLIEQSLPTRDVTFLLGYQSESQFFKAFKNWFSITPMAYQKQHNPSLKS